MISLKVIDRETVQAETEVAYRFEMPICHLEDTDLNIIGFDSMGNSYMIKRLAQSLYKADQNIAQADVIVCPEAKAIPIAQELARVLGIRYFVLRKSKKAYMKKPECIEVESITTKGKQQLWYDKADVERYLTNVNDILLFDDVVSTGSSLKALEKFVLDNSEYIEHANIFKGTIFLEGDSIGRTDIIHLGKLPIIKDDKLDSLVGESLDNYK